LAETPSHPAYLASYWSVCLGSKLIMAQDSQRIDTVKLMYSGRLVPLFKPGLVPPQAKESDPTLLCVRVDSETEPTISYHPSILPNDWSIARGKRSGQKPPCMRQQKVDSSGIEPETLHMLSVRSAN
jgi:hypothetical protein